MSSSKKQRWLIIGLLISNAVLITFLVLGHPSFRKPPSPKMAVIERLDFTSEQVAAYEELIITHKEKVAQFDSQIRELRLQLYTGLAEDTGEESILLGQLAILQTEAEQVKLDHFRAIKKICSPDQIPKFDALTKDLSKIFSRQKPQQQKPKQR